MIDSERDAIFAKARCAASPTDANRRRVRAAIACRLGACAAATVSAAATNSAASALPVASAVGTGMSAAAAVKIVVALVTVVGASVIVNHVLPSRPERLSTTAETMSAAIVPAAPIATGASLATVASRVEAQAPPARPISMPTATSAMTEPRVTGQARPAFANPPATPPMPLAPATVAAPPPSSAPISEAAEPAASPVAFPDQTTPTFANTAVETALVASMQAALRDGDTQRVLMLVNDHERRFPSGMLAPEREAARALALCTGTNPFDAARIGQAFLDAHPRSPLAGRVRETCRIRVDNR